MTTARVTLLEAFESVPDPRQASGKRHPLPAILSLCSVAMLSGARSLYAIAQFGRDRGKALADALGFARGTTPACTTLHYLFARLDHAAFESALTAWVGRGGDAAAGPWTVVSVDGKTLRGATGRQLPGVHLLAAYAHEARVVLAQLPVDAQTNEHKAALELLDILPVKGKVVVGDAAFCQRDLSRKIIGKRGDYLWSVKDNQPTLQASIRDAFDDQGVSPPRVEAGPERTPAGHHRRQGARPNRGPHPRQHHPAR